MSKYVVINVYFVVGQKSFFLAWPVWLRGLVDFFGLVLRVGSPFNSFRNILIPYKDVCGLRQPYICLLEWWFVIILTYGTLIFPFLTQLCMFVHKPTSMLNKIQFLSSLRDSQYSEKTLLRFRIVSKFSYCLRFIIFNDCVYKPVDLSYINMTILLFWT